MPNFTLPRNHTLTTTTGHMITFVKDQPTHVPASCVSAAVAIGAAPSDGSSVSVLPAEAQPIKELDAASRAKTIADNIDKMAKKDDRGDFAASGAPQLKRLAELCGFSISNAERDEAWRKYIETRAVVEG